MPPEPSVASAELPGREMGGAPVHAPVTARAVLLGLAGAVAVSALQVVNTVAPQSVVLPVGTVFTLFAGAILWLFLLALVNVVLRRLRPRAALRPAEFAVIYALTTVAASIAEHDEVQFLPPMFLYAFRKTQFETMGHFRQFIPSWLVPQDPDVVELYYRGHTTFWQAHLVLAWLVPLVAWMAFLMAVGATMWSWNVLLRRRWVDHDRLSFPCVQLPLEMCRAAGFGGMVSGRLFWSGVSVSAAVETLAQLHARLPNFPGVTLDLQATPIIQSWPVPWNALAPMYMTWSTFHLGVCYMIPVDILFSSWFFYVLRKGLEVFGYAHNWRSLGWDAAGFPFTRAQAAGAWAALFFLLIWTERHHLGRAFASAFSRRAATGEAAAEDAGEPCSYRGAARLLMAATLFQILWLMAAGLSPLLAVAYNGFFWILFVTMTRIYAQVGPPILELYFLDPQQTLTSIFGTLGESPRSLTIFSLMYWINRDHRGQPMAHQLSAFYIGKATGTDLRALGRWVLVAFGVGALTCLLVYLHWAYRVGEDQFVSGGWRESGAPHAVSRIGQWVNAPTGPDWTQISYMLVGGVTTLALAKANYTFIGLPFHPIGFALAMSFAVEYNWPAFFLMWLVKGTLIRYGGLTVYLRFVPFFLGLTLGGLLAPIFWGFISWLFEWYRM